MTACGLNVSAQWNNLYWLDWVLFTRLFFPCRDKKLWRGQGLWQRSSCLESDCGPGAMSIVQLNRHFASIRLSWCFVKLHHTVFFLCCLSLLNNILSVGERKIPAANYARLHRLLVSTCSCARNPQKCNICRALNQSDLDPLICAVICVATSCGAVISPRRKTDFRESRDSPRSIVSGAMRQVWNPRCTPMVHSSTDSLCTSMSYLSTGGRDKHLVLWLSPPPPPLHRPRRECPLLKC